MEREVVSPSTDAARFVGCFHYFLVLFQIYSNCIFTVNIDLATNFLLFSGVDHINKTIFIDNHKTIEAGNLKQKQGWVLSAGHVASVERQPCLMFQSKAVIRIEKEEKTIWFQVEEKEGWIGQRQGHDCHGDKL